ncbi:unnamed protein product [Prunus brigantina]
MESSRTQREASSSKEQPDKAQEPDDDSEEENEENDDDSEEENEEEDDDDGAAEEESEDKDDATEDVNEEHGDATEEENEEEEDAEVNGEHDHAVEHQEDEIQLTKEYMMAINNAAEYWTKKGEHQKIHDAIASCIKKNKLIQMLYNEKEELLKHQQQLQKMVKEAAHHKQVIQLDVHEENPT